MKRLYATLVLWPAGASPGGANCLGDCAGVKTVKVGPEITGGRGHARVATTRAGVNGGVRHGRERVRVDGERRRA